jgi:hypothetical protein
MYPNMTASTDEKTFGGKNSQAKINTSIGLFNNNKQYSLL